ncbi:MAG TPA: M12 family metallo-peptidase, partial [Chitinophagaceae bacterium]|nr:M12 family metallo-peptidase [Chitinophagaceae bacterium]
MRRHLLLIASLFITIIAGSQQLWKEESSASQLDYLSRNSGTLPASVKFYTLDAQILQTRMLEARAFDATATTATLELPLPDGSFITADVYESSILTPQLQATIPNVKTYALVDKVSKSSLGRVTIYDNAITGLIFSDKGTVYINPVNSNNNRVHITYFTKEVHYPVPVACGVKDEQGRESGSGAARIYAGDCQLRTYDLAVAATGEYYVWAGSSQANALAYITIAVNNINAVYERDATIRFNLVTNNSIIYTDAATDPYATVGFPNGALLTANNSATDLELGAGAYDVGIVFNDGWNGGLAQLSSVCGASHGRAAAGIDFGTGSNPTAGPQGPVFEGTVAHEIAHQFSATHTMIANNDGCAGNVTAATAYEPGGGSTIMAYAGTCTGNAYQGNSDLYFHAGSVAQIAGFATTGAGNGCPVTTALANVAPTVNVAAASYTIPVSTPFVLTCSASDANANDLTYTWEQMDAAAEISTPPLATSTTGPNFRSFPQSISPTRYF